MQEAILYVHTPFCSSKCHFCSWVSPIPTAQLVRAHPKFSAYADAVVQEIRTTANRLKPGQVRPSLIYFGGGTPSLLSGQDLARILSELHSQFPHGGGFLDTTIEMSPDTANPEKLQTLLEAGFNRISFGVQSFIDQRARSLGRAHTPQTAMRAFEMARQAGFENINIDLMIGLPEESEQEFQRNVETALLLDPDHISIYVYKKIQGTVLARLIDIGKLAACSKETAVARYDRATSMLAAAGYSEYMFQLFGKRGKRCLVDYHYFNLDFDYLGFGQGAHTLLAGKTYAHAQSLDQYLRKPGPSQAASASESDTLLENKLFEMMHTEGGLDYDRFHRRMRVSFHDALAGSKLLRTAVDGVLSTSSAESSGSGIRIGDRTARINWLVSPPHWLSAPSPQPAQSQLVSIGAAI